MSSDRISLKAKTVAIVGAGPSGVIAAKYLRAEKTFDKIVLFEQRAKPGGIWIYTPDQVDEDLFTVPQLDPIGKNQDPEWEGQGKPHLNGANGHNGTNGADKVPSFLSPMYENLETNIPRGLMRFKDLDWPADAQLFPRHETVLEYIAEYGKDVQHLVQYSTQVTNADPLSSQPDTQWQVSTRHLPTDTSHSEVFDALVVANGHFITPYIPPVPGLEEWHARWPGSISHSKYYRTPSAFAQKKVVVIGNSASGADISAQIAATQCSKPLLWSSRTVNMFSATHGSADTSRLSVPEITSLDPSTRTAVFADGSTHSGIDALVFCTGYFYSLPFLCSLPSLVTDGSHVQNTYHHLFHASHPSLSFLGLNQRVIPFPVAEAQAAVLARFLSSRLSLPSSEVMQKWYETTLRDTPRRRDFHLLQFPRDGEYINMLAAWADSAPQKDGLDSGGRGKIPPRWGEWEFWCRENFPAIRAAFGKLGEDRKKVKRVEEVGYDYAEYVRGKQEEQGRNGQGEKEHGMSNHKS